jgi:hypothetical protein
VSISGPSTAGIQWQEPSAQVVEIVSRTASRVLFPGNFPLVWEWSVIVLTTLALLSLLPSAWSFLMTCTVNHALAFSLLPDDWNPELFIFIKACHIFHRYFAKYLAVVDLKFYQEDISKAILFRLSIPI